MHEQLATVESAQWESLAERYLLKHVRMLEVSSESRIAAQAAATMQRSRGILGVAEIAARSGVSAPHLERAFQEQIGVSPKMFGRLLRLDHALELAKSGSKWAEVAGACGYFDQSHLVRDFRSMTGVTPLEFAALRAASPQS